VTTAVGAVRLAAGALLLWYVLGTIAGPEFLPVCSAGAIVILAATAWRARWGLILVTVLAPAGAILAGPPARAAELFAWSFVAGWLVSAWRPLSWTGWPRRVMLPLGLYAGALVASWLALTIGGAAGVPVLALPQFIAHAIPRDHLLLSSPEPETWTLLQSLAGVATFAAATAIARDDPRTSVSMAWAIVASMAILAAATLVSVAAQWRDAGYAAEFLERYLRGERFSLPMADVNAAGSLYAIAAVVALGCAWARPGQRWMWLSLLAVLAPGIWLSGSRSAYFAIVSGLAAFGGVRRYWQPTGHRVTAGVLIFLAAMVAAAVLVDPQSEGSAGQSANLRSQFLLTSGRMFASAPVFGVGVGRYFGRSGEFMTPELRDLYGNENAHNYFAQQFVELGIVGGALFVWLLSVVLSHGWKGAHQASEDAHLQALFAGVVAYVLTCTTGHPLLVPEAALPFWAAFGTVAGRASSVSTLPKAWRAIGIAAGVILAAGVGRAALAYAQAADSPPEQGFHQMETTTDGSRFRWMTRHGVTYIPDGPGFLRVRVRAPGWPAPRPVILETSIAGQVVDRHDVAPDTSTTYDVPVRAGTSAGFRRVDFRVNQEWFEEVRLGQRRARRPVSVMVEQIEWKPLR
jgi:O-antigen ligase